MWKTKALLPRVVQEARVGVTPWSKTILSLSSLWKLGGGAGGRAEPREGLGYSSEAAEGSCCVIYETIVSSS